MANISNHTISEDQVRGALREVKFAFTNYGVSLDGTIGQKSGAVDLFPGIKPNGFKLLDDDLCRPQVFAEHFNHRKPIRHAAIQRNHRDRG